MRMFARAAAILAIGVTTAAGLAGTPAAAAPAPATAPPASTAELIPYGAGSAAVEQQRSAIAARHNAAAQAVLCWHNVTIYANANRRWVSMEKGYSGTDNGMLRARATVVGPWERFVVCRDNVTGYTYWASQDTGLVVSTELGYSAGDYGMLRARATIVGPWEQYYTTSQPGSWFSMYAYGNGRWVSTEIGYSAGDYGMLRARATVIGPWEQYYW
ncbi:fascin domain-containing protein [Couchioplanes azureus]|uniref:fascin domain-containing protein n=1 Tax=Couchioplanes caeruleus TaxID=56438 RepID=UPI001670965F|nr:hypothetical protein [Couchioplanes caeruleus]GGQ76756.1 hypothetical protein GCM10010166_53350 [Couchioplanes caeruleus subsp. azureus]